MIKSIVYILFTLSLSLMACACDDGLEINQQYGFTVEHLPVPKKLKKGETAEIRLHLIREGRWDGAKYRMHYFQPDGKGELRDSDGTVFLPNDLYDIEKEIFRFYYTSHSEEAQTLNLYFIDNFNGSCTLSFSFNHAGDDEE